MNKRILVVASHPDDEILGCAGTIAKLVKQGYRAYTLILGEGITSRDMKRDRKKKKNSIERLKKEALEANRFVGARDTFMRDFPDNRFDAVDFIEIVKAVEKVKNDIKPEIIFTHYEKDLNIDHQITYKAVITATRPIPDETVREIYSFEIASSTEWNYPVSFSPDTFFDISETIENKLKALEIYKAELRDFPHPRSIEGVRLKAKYWGMLTGLGYAEAFRTIRVLK